MEATIPINGIQRCNNGHMCMNSSKCVDHTTSDKKTFKCDCDEEFVDKEYSNLQCKHGDEASTEYCAFTSEALDDNKVKPVRLSFCANFGTCKAKITSEEPYVPTSVFM